jgi:hypothetical protein
MLHVVHPSVKDRAKQIIAFIDSIPIDYSAINYCKLYLFLLNQQLNISIAELIKLSGLSGILQPRKGWVSAGNMLFIELQYQFPDK